MLLNVYLLENYLEWILFDKRLTNSYYIIRRRVNIKVLCYNRF